MIETRDTDTGRHPGMHATDTLDYAVVLAGELTLILQDNEVTLRTGDTLVNRGVMHAWENRGTETAYCVFVNIGALP